MAKEQITIRGIGDKVVIVTKIGVEEGTIALRDLQNDNTIKYAVKTNSQRNYTHRLGDQVFSDITQLLTYYTAKFK